ncbi:MAG: hypothetical protein RLZZ241_346 [Bacteroidota bacterium]|jgi:L-ascorbate metabolism protein UlaG (beta-lactamase superfamily)
MKITYLGHSALQIDIDTTQLVVDPFITGNPLAKDQISLRQLAPNYVLITHAHQDHILDAETLAKQSGAVIVSNFEIVHYYKAKGLEGLAMNYGGTLRFPFGWLKYVNAVHSSSFPDGTYGGQPGGFLLRANGKTIYIAGDTALHTDMKLIPEYGAVDLAVLPIGDNFTMGAEDAVRAAGFVQCNRVLGVHYDTFPPIRIDREKAVSCFVKAGKKLLLPNIGETLTV